MRITLIYQNKYIFMLSTPPDTVKLNKYRKTGPFVSEQPCSHGGHTVYLSLSLPRHERYSLRSCTTVTRTFRASF